VCVNLKEEVTKEVWLGNFSVTLNTRDSNGATILKWILKYVLALRTELNRTASLTNLVPVVSIRSILISEVVFYTRDRTL